jgi:hypothetical protein
MCALYSSDRTHYGHSLWQTLDFKRAEYLENKRQLTADKSKLAEKEKQLTEKIKQAYEKEKYLRTKSQEQPNAGATRLYICLDIFEYCIPMQFTHHRHVLCTVYMYTFSETFSS